MKNIVPIVGINLLVLLGYSLLIHFNASVSERGLDIMIYSAELVALHIFVTLFFGIANFKTNKPLG